MPEQPTCRPEELAAAAAVVESADAMWRRHVDQLRTRLAITYGGDEVTDEAAVQVSRAASDIDAARIQISAPAATARDCVQAVTRARRAADRLLASSRRSLDASDPVTEIWRDVHAGYRRAVGVLQPSDTNVRREH